MDWVNSRHAITSQFQSETWQVALTSLDAHYGCIFHIHQTSPSHITYHKHHTETLALLFNDINPLHL
jgi:nitrate reductase assembly molybdenum cofactor insertion protein NarJ